MPNRVIKESILYSNKIKQLSAEDERLFTRLLVIVDDYGRFDGNIDRLLSAVFPRLREITEDQLEKWMSNLQIAGLIFRYNVDGKPYFLIRKWNKHQQIRAKKSKFPPPCEFCNQLKSDDCMCLKMSPKTETETETESEKETDTETETESISQTKKEKNINSSNFSNGSAASAAVSFIQKKEETPFQMLFSAGVNQKTAIKLAGHYSPNEIIQQIQWLPRRKANNPAAVLVKSIQENWEEPPPTPEEKDCLERKRQDLLYAEEERKRKEDLNRMEAEVKPPPPEFLSLASKLGRMKSIPA